MKFQNTLYLDISASKSYFSNSPKRLWKPWASRRNFASKTSGSKISAIRTPLLVILVLYVGPKSTLIFNSLLLPSFYAYLCLYALCLLPHRLVSVILVLEGLKQASDL